MPEIYRADGRAVCGSVSDLVGPGMQVRGFVATCPNGRTVNSLSRSYR